jgi:hypothetical protein
MMHPHILLTSSGLDNRNETKEGYTILKRRIIDHYICFLGLDPLHDALNDWRSLQMLYLGIGIQLIEIGYTECEGHVHEQLCILFLHEQHQNDCFNSPCYGEAGNPSANF